MIGIAQPLLLGFAALVALPVVVHWLTRGRAVARFFPALALVVASDAGRARRHRLRERTVLALRAIALLAAALAICGLQWSGPMASQSQPLVVILDASASMRQTVAGATAMSRARARAGELLTSSAHTRPVAAVIADGSGRHSVPAVQAGAALALLGESAASCGDGAPAAALAQAVQLLPHGGDIAWVTDLARTSLGGCDPASLPAGIHLRMIDAGPGPGACPMNLAVTALTTEPSVVVALRPVTLVARIANSSAMACTGPVTITAGGRTTVVITTVPAGGTTLVRQTWTPEASGVADVAVAVASSDPTFADVLAEDDQRQGLVVVHEALVAVVAGEGVRDDPHGPLRPLVAGLEAAGFRVRQTDAAGLSASLTGATLCATASLRQSAVAAAALGPWMQAGGTWVQVAAEPGDAACVPASLAPPVALGPRLDLGDQGRAALTLGSVKLDHRVFSAFTGREALLTPLRCYRLFLTPTAPAPDATVLAVWSDGTVAMAERPVGAGHWWLLNCGTDAAGSNLASSEAWPLWCAALPETLVNGPGSDLAVACGTLMPGGCTAKDGHGAATPDVPDMPGRWTTADGKPFMAALPATESDLRPLDPALLGVAVSRGDEAAQVASTQPLWPWLVALAVLALGLELLLAGGVRK